ncbi:MAG: hypothetical protein OXU64_06030 [Gemmatimonadota bacterium]|nr:hypothetical protein [Gemmatimonadota bacterium]
MRFPFPPFATNPDEAVAYEARDRERTETIMASLGAMSGAEAGL